MQKAKPGCLSVVYGHAFHPWRTPSINRNREVIDLLNVVVRLCGRFQGNTEA
jgi:hypothetical protein